LYAGFGWKIGGKEPLERLRRGWKDNVKTYFQEVRWGDMDWINLADDTDRWLTSESCGKPSCSIKCGEFLD
jgi:hypothetical protein